MSRHITGSQIWDSNKRQRLVASGIFLEEEGYSISTESRLLSSCESEGENKMRLNSKYYFTMVRVTCQMDVSVYHTLLELQHFLTLWWVVSKCVIEGLFLHLRDCFCFFCHCDEVSLISRPCCCSWALSSALSFFRSSICRTMDIQHITTCPIGLGQ